VVWGFGVGGCAHPPHPPNPNPQSPIPNPHIFKKMKIFKIKKILNLLIKNY
jgi:hypothetical protein